MKRRNRLFSGMIVCLIATAGFARAGTLDNAFRSADSAPWGSNQSAIARNFNKKDITFATKSLLSVPANLGEYEGSMNYLFNKQGKFYNLAWYALIPVADMRGAQDLERRMEIELRAKYGDPVYTFSDGDASKAGEVAARGGATRQDAAKMLHAPDRLPKDASGKVDINQMMMMMPSIFYSKLAFWDGGAFWAYTNLLCSTDGTCYLHLQFVSKKLTRDEKYRPTPEVNFSYSPLDRDQDLVTDTHQAWNDRQSRGK